MAKTRNVLLAFAFALTGAASACTAAETAAEEATSTPPPHCREASYAQPKGLPGAFCVTPGSVMARPGMAGMKTLLDTQAEPQEFINNILYLCSENGWCVTGSDHVMDCDRLNMKPQ